MALTGPRRTLLAVLVSVLFVATAVASVWLMASAGVFTTGDVRLPSAPGVAVTAPPSVAISPRPTFGAIQVSPPRDPFEPLVDDTTTTQPVDGSTTTVADGGSTTSTTGPGGSTSSTTSTTGPGGSTTSTTLDNTPDGTRIVLLEINDVAGVREATVTVDGELFTVRVGDTFSTDLKVVSLSDDGGVFQFGNNVFSLAIGQAILK